MTLPIQWTQQSIVRCLMFNALCIVPTLCQAQEIGSAISRIEAGGKGIAEAREAVKQLQSNKHLKLEDLLRLTARTNPVAKNWYLAIIQEAASHGDPQQTSKILSRFLEDKSADPDTRYWAFDYLTAGDKLQREAMLAGMLDDSSLDIRYEAVDLAMKKIEDAKSKGATDGELKHSYSQVLAAARLPDQVQAIAKKLDELGTKVDLLQHFGFLNRWQVVAPFDNRNQSGFNVAYGPEIEYLQRNGTVDLKGQHDGKAGKVGWRETTTAAADGAVDLNPTFSNEQGAICYAFAEFQADRDAACEVRLGCTNANRVWVNGLPVLSNEVYHAGVAIDQYSAAVKLKKGRNSVLVKVCQNEQTEDWAKDWKFQLRFTDSSGRAIPNLALRLSSNP